MDGLMFKVYCSNVGTYIFKIAGVVVYIILVVYGS